MRIAPKKARFFFLCVWFRLQKHKIVECNRQNIVRFANYTLQKLGKIVGWRLQNQEREGGLKAEDFLQINPLELM